MTDLQANVITGSRSLKMYAKKLEKLEITTFEQLLFHIPSRYEDYSVISPIRKVQEGEVVTIRGKITDAKNDFTRRYKTIQKITVADETGEIQLIFFNQTYLTKSFSFGDTISVSGRVDRFSNKLSFISPDYELLPEGAVAIHTGRLVPIYPETYGVSSKWLRRQIYSLLSELTEIHDHLPKDVIKTYNLSSLFNALWQIHFPDSFEKAYSAKERLAFDELLLLQIAGLYRKKLWRENKIGLPLSEKKFTKEIKRLLESLPFTLTSSQDTALREIFSDLTSGKPMNRLLQGDVGSGKTIVAAMSMYLAHLNGYESVLMAPTEILAKQHYKTIESMLQPLGVRIGLATASEKRNTAQGEFDMLIGTHALLNGKIAFEKLGLVVIDEQQRFGVEQRGILRGKGETPHLLTMTATPIPRTVALTLYGELTISFLSEMPKGRKQIKTWLVPQVKRDGAYEWIEKEIKTNNSQIFIICPFIEESESMQTVKAAKVEYERLQKDVFPHLRLGMLHGKMKAKEKDVMLKDFKEKTYDILVATPVVEVGIDIPNATVIVIEASERFGLAQLHQLRGRVGRGDKQSYCLLFTETTSEQTRLRLKAMETMHSGAALAEFDLKMRGPGELYGTKQSGTRILKIASFADTELLQKTRKAAEELLPKIEIHPELFEKLNHLLEKGISPD